MSFSPSAASIGVEDLQFVFRPSAPHSTEDPLSLPPGPSLHLGLSTLRRHLGSSPAIRLLQAPSSLWLCLGQSSTCLHLQFRLTLPSPRLHFHPRSHRLSLCSLVPRFHLGCSLVADSPRSPVYSALRGLIGSTWISIFGGCISVSLPTSGLTSGTSCSLLPHGSSHPPLSHRLILVLTLSCLHALPPQLDFSSLAFPEGDDL